MSIPDHIERVEAALRSTRRLLGSGVTPRQLREWVQTGKAVRVAQGWFVDGAVWNSWYPEGRHLARVIAAHRNAKTPPLFSHYSAAVLLRLPVWHLRTSHVHVVSEEYTSTSNSVQRHQLSIDASHQISVAGYRCTTHQRTLFDLATCTNAETLLGCLDKSLREASMRGRVLDEGAQQRWRSEMDALIDSASPRRRGLANLRRALAIADPRAESVLESVSRLQLLRLGYEVELQVPVRAPSGSLYYMDFELLGYNAFGECDGEVKYTDPEMLAGQTPAERVIGEKRRDNWTMGTTNKLMAHWGTRDVGTPAQLAKVLRSYHVPLPRYAGRTAN